MLVLFLSRPGESHLSEVEISKEIKDKKTKYQEKIKGFIEQTGMGNFLDEGCLDKYGLMNWQSNTI